METEIVSRPEGRKEKAWRELLRQTGLTPEESEQTVLIWEEGILVAAGSRQGNLFKCIAVAQNRQGEGLTATLLTVLRQEAFRAGFDHLFLYTKPENQALFSSLFFYPVAKTARVLLMESRRNGIRTFLEGLPLSRTAGQIGAVVMNCDPFTRGHRHLVETAAGECDHVYVFVLSEDRGFFSAADRMEMVKRGTKDIPNVTVLSTGPYLISAATFPTYFLKDRERAPEIQCQLDIRIFARHFAPRFGITHRYVGTEPLSPMTNRYNEELKARLPGDGIQVREVPRYGLQEGPVSASRVRELLKRGDREEVFRLVPQTTMGYLMERNLLIQEERL